MRPGSQPVVLCAGIVVADAIASPVDAAPPPGLLTLVDSVQLATGGCALSTATALGRLGTPTALCGCVGDDLLGDVVRREAHARDIGTDGLRTCSVAIKLGRDGAYALDDETSEFVPPFTVETRDETGAGDAFAAGLIHGLAEGLPLARAVRLGNAVGALSTRGMGASSTLPDAEEALAL
jgi:sugar/nucleoside kinase (ribokinase family)